jgi:hypothetical protein
MNDTDSSKGDSEDSEPLSFPIKLSSGSVSSSYREGIAMEAPNIQLPSKKVTVRVSCRRMFLCYM